jgi:hypothetical protein
MSMRVCKPYHSDNVVVLVQPDITAGHSTFIGITSAYRSRLAINWGS